MLFTSFPLFTTSLLAASAVALTLPAEQSLAPPLSASPSIPALSIGADVLAKSRKPKSTSTKSTSTKAKPSTTSITSANHAAKTTAPSASAAPTSLSCPGSNGASFTTGNSVFQVQCYQDHFGGDLSYAGTSTFNVCLQLCASTEGCVDVSYTGGICYMKSSIQPVQQNSGVWGAQVVKTLGASTSSAKVVSTTTAKSSSTAKSSTSKATSSKTSTTLAKSTTKSATTTTKSSPTSKSSSKVSSISSSASTAGGASSSSSSSSSWSTLSSLSGIPSSALTATSSQGPVAWTTTTSASSSTSAPTLTSSSSSSSVSSSASLLTSVASFTSSAGANSSSTLITSTKASSTSSSSTIQTTSSSTTTYANPFQTTIVEKTMSKSQNKRGLAYNDPELTFLFGGSKSQVTWMYDWGQDLCAGANQDFECIPMLWGDAPNILSTWNATVHSAISAGATRVLGFNEPDYADQANMIPKTAAKTWIQYMQPYAGMVELGGPAVTGQPSGLVWLQEFYGNLTHLNATALPDFQPVHWYDEAWNVGWFKLFISDAYQVANVPVWITEFEGFGTDAQQAEFVQEVTPWLDASDWIGGYAYFGVFNEYLVINNGTGNNTSGWPLLSLTGAAFDEYYNSTVPASMS